MNTITIRIGKRSHKATLPSSWGEVPESAWAGLYGCVVSEQTFSRELVHLLLRNEKGRKYSRAFVGRLPIAVLGQLFDCLQWLITEPLVSPHLPAIRVGKAEYLLPASQFRNLTVIEFAFVDMAWQLRGYFLQQQNKQQAEAWTARLFAYLCRPKDWRRVSRDPDTYAGDLREAFNPAIAEERHVSMQQMKVHDQFWVLAYVAGCKQQLRASYPSIWSKDARDPREIQQNAKGQKPQPRIWLDLCRQMSGGKFGTFEETQRTDLYIFLDELSAQLKEQKRREREAAHRKAFRR